MMRPTILAVPLLLVALPAFGQSLPDSLDMSCAAAQSIVREQGAAVIASGPSIYDRFVTDQGYCTIGQTTFPAWIPTTDSPQCFVGYRCRERMIHNR